MENDGSFIANVIKLVMPTWGFQMWYLCWIKATQSLANIKEKNKRHDFVEVLILEATDTLGSAAAVSYIHKAASSEWGAWTRKGSEQSRLCPPRPATRHYDSASQMLLECL